MIQQPPNPLPLAPAAFEGPRCHRAFFLIPGVALMVPGTLAVGAAFITTLTSVLVFGILLLGAGGVQIVNAFRARSWQGSFPVARQPVLRTQP